MWSLTFNLHSIPAYTHIVFHPNKKVNQKISLVNFSWNTIGSAQMAVVVIRDAELLTPPNTLCEWTAPNGHSKMQIIVRNEWTAKARTSPRVWCGSFCDRLLSSPTIFTIMTDLHACSRQPPGEHRAYTWFAPFTLQVVICVCSI